MSLLGSAFDVVRGSAEQRTTLGPVLADLLNARISTDAGVAVDSETAMQMSTVYGARRIIAYSVASLPADVLVKKTEGKRSVRRSYSPEPVWLRGPNREQLWPEFCAQMVDSLLSDGNLFLDVSNKDRLGRPAALFVLDPRAIVVGRMKEPPHSIVYADTKGRVIDSDTIVHVRALTLPGHDRGLSPIEMARQQIGIDKSAQKVLAKFYVNGATVSAVLEFPAGMSEEEVRTHAATFRDLYAGGDNAHKIAAVAAATYKPMGVTFEQQQFLAQREFTVIDIGTRIYGIPPHRLGASTTDTEFGNTVEQQNMSFVQDAVVPWTTLLEAAFTRWILPAPAYFKFNLNGLLRGDAAGRAQFYQTMRQQLGVMNADDILALEDMDPLPDGKGQAYWMPANTYLVGAQGFPILPERQPAPGGQK